MKTITERLYEKADAETMDAVTKRVYALKLGYGSMIVSLGYIWTIKKGRPEGFPEQIPDGVAIEAERLREPIIRALFNAERDAHREKAVAEFMAKVHDVSAQVEALQEFASSVSAG